MSVTLPNGLTLPNNNGGIQGDYTAQEKTVKADQEQLNQDVKALDQVYSQSAPVDANTAQLVAKAYDTYQKDSQKFADDHAYLMQIAEQDAISGKGDGEVQAAIAYGEGTRVTENNVAQYARLFEQNRNLVQTLGGPSSAAVQSMHNDVNGIVASANEVGAHDATIGPSTNTSNTPGNINSPF